VWLRRSIGGKALLFRYILSIPRGYAAALGAIATFSTIMRHVEIRSPIRAVEDGVILVAHFARCGTWHHLLGAVEDGGIRNLI
jgi:hypothetical protein